MTPPYGWRQWKPCYREPRRRDDARADRDHADVDPARPARVQPSRKDSSGSTQLVVPADSMATDLTVIGTTTVVVTASAAALGLVTRESAAFGPAAVGSAAAGATAAGAPAATTSSTTGLIAIVAAALEHAVEKATMVPAVVGQATVTATGPEARCRDGVRC